MGKVCTRLLLMALVFCFFITSAPFVLAQDDGNDEFMLEEITVTAQKREENQQKVAIAMEVVSSDTITELGYSSIDDILSNVSNVIINKSSDGMRISLRGLADDSSLNMSGQHVSTPTVAVNIDGAYNNTSSAGQGLFDVERVEVMFGPQSTMYASNSPGGIVNVVTASPKVDKYEASGLIEYGSYDLLHTQGALNVPVTETVALRAAYSTSVQDGYISNGGGEEDTKSARLKALYQPTEDLSLTLTGNYSISGGASMASVEAFGNQDEKDDPWTSSEDLASSNDQKTKGITADFSLNTGVGSLAVVPSYSESTSSGTQTSTMNGETTTSINDMENSQTGAEARMTSDPDFFFTWILGANYYESEDTRSTDYVDSTQSTYSLNNQKSYAFFGNITYPLTNVLRATAGYRHSWDEITNYSEELNKPDGDGVTDMISDTLSKYDSPDIKIGLEYDMEENIMVYANYATSYRMQGMGMANADGETAPPEELDAYTIGAKSRFFDSKLQVNASAYFYKYENKTANQMKEEVFYESGELNGNYDIDINGDGEISGSAALHDANSQTWGNFETLGADIQATWVITSNDKLNGSISWMDSEWTYLVFEYEYPDFYETEVFTGMTNTYSPEWTINLAYDHRFMLPNGGGLTAKVDGQYQSDYILTWTEDDAPYNYQESYTMYNASLVYANPDGNWTFSVYGKNLTNYAKKTSYMMNSLMIDSPRTFGAVLTVRY